MVNLRFLNILEIVLVCLSMPLISCGSHEDSKEELCIMRPSFEKSSDSKDSSEYDSLKYTALLSDSCKEIVHNKSGGFYFKLEAIGEPSNAVLTSVDMGPGRILSFASKGSVETTSMKSGSLSTEKEFLSQGVKNSKDGGWILPWPNIPTDISVYFDLPKKSEQVLYPRSVEIYFKSLDN